MVDDKRKINLVIVGGIRTHYIKINAFQTMIMMLDEKIVSKFNFIYVDAGQHYDDALRKDFIDELDIKFDYKIHHEKKNNEYLWGSMLQKLGTVFEQIDHDHTIDYIIVFGDVITTALASLVAIFKHYKIVHIESGIRIKDSNSVEEKCRIIVDHMAAIRFTSNVNDLESLVAEGLGKDSFFSGDIIYDYIKNISISSYQKSIVYKYDSKNYKFDLDQEFILISIHHAENQNVSMLRNVFSAFSDVPYKVIFIVHPAIKQIISKNHISSPNIDLADHIDYRSNLLVIKNAKYIVTDSGGIQREAFYLNKRCVVCSSITVWQAIVDTGNSIIVKNNIHDFYRGITWAEANEKRDCVYDNTFGNGNAVYTILKTIREVFNE